MLNVVVKCCCTQQQHPTTTTAEVWWLVGVGTGLLFSRHSSTDDHWHKAMCCSAQCCVGGTSQPSSAASSPWSATFSWSSWSTRSSLVPPSTRWTVRRAPRRGWCFQYHQQVRHHWYNQAVTMSEINIISTYPPSPPTRCCQWNFNKCLCFWGTVLILL